MPENAFLVALEKTTAGQFTLGDLVATAEILVRGGQPALARQIYRVWAKINASDPLAKVAYFNCAVLDGEAGELAMAIEALRQAIEIDPDFMPAYINLGSALERSGSADAGVLQWKALVDRLPTVTGPGVEYKLTALKQIARVLADNQRLALAELAMHEGLQIKADQRDVLEQYMSARLGQCKWPLIEPFEGLDRESLVGGIHPLSLAAYADDPLFQLGAADRYAEHLVRQRTEMLGFDRRDERIDLTGRRLRVGYVSSDLRDHAVGYLMAEMLELHDREKIEVFAYYCGIPASGGLNARIREAVEHWVDIRGMSDEDAARRVAEDGIDILVDVNGHTRDARSALFARRPAPIIVNWLGYPGTMGTPYHHYIVADDCVIPPGDEIYYSEKVLRLPCYQSNDRRRAVAPERPTRAAAGLPDDAFVFCCFNGAHKITQAIFERWMEILRQTPHGVLWLLEGTPETVARLRAEAQARGIAPGRLIFAPKIANLHHLARYPLADLFLDTSPYGAHTTASDALFMGVPVLTFAGRCFAARVCASLVSAAGLPDLVCEGPQDYVARAVALAHAPAETATLRERLVANRDTCVLFDMDLFTASLEALYFQMAADQAAGKLPRPDLANTEAYFKIGRARDHAAADQPDSDAYRAHYAEELSRMHRLRPLAADTRLWTAEAIARADAPFGGALETKAEKPRRRTAA